MASGRSDRNIFLIRYLYQPALTYDLIDIANLAYFITSWLLSSDSLLRLSKKEKDPNKRDQLLAVTLYLECQNRTLVARTLKVARRSVNNWVTI